MLCDRKLLIGHSTHALDEDLSPQACEPLHRHKGVKRLQNKFRAFLKVDSRQVSLGLYSTEDEAARAVDEGHIYQVRISSYKRQWQTRTHARTHARTREHCRKHSFFDLKKDLQKELKLRIVFDQIKQHCRALRR